MIDTTKFATNTNPYGLPYDINQFKSAPTGAPTTGTTQWGQPQTQQGFSFPSQWDTASNILNYFGTGGATATPSLWTQGGDIATQMAQTGQPVTTMPYYQAMKGVVQGDISDAIKQATEQAGLSGLRYSTPLGRQVSDIAGRTMGQFGASALGNELAAMEAARSRQMQALPQMYQFGQGTAGLTEAAKNRAMQAAGMLPGLGQMYAQLPGDIAQQAMNMGLTMQQAQQMAYQPLLQEFYRTMPESNPWLNPAMNLGQMQYGYQYPQYQPSFMSQMLNAGMEALPYALMASSMQFKKDIDKISDVDEGNIYKAMKDTPIFNYKYKFESENDPKHLGLITEYAPEELTMFSKKAIGLYEYISALHATIKTLIKKVEKLEKD